MDWEMLKWKAKLFCKIVSYEIKITGLKIRKAKLWLRIWIEDKVIKHYGGNEI